MMRRASRYIVRLAAAGVAVVAGAPAISDGVHALSPSGSRPLHQEGLDRSRNNFVYEPGTKVVELGTLGHVEKRGTGPIPMILVPGHGFGCHVFADFMSAKYPSVPRWRFTTRCQACAAQDA